MNTKNKLPSCIAVVGLGYVGLPLACAFGRIVPTIGFDVNEKRIDELTNRHDNNLEVPKGLLETSDLHLTADPSRLRQASFVVIAVPTPIDQFKRPDLAHLCDATRLVGRHLSEGAVVVYESSVYPGCTEEVCIPLLEKESGLKAGTGFKVGYSPERINPGDTEHRLETVVKVVAAQDDETTDYIAGVYGLIVKAGIYKAANIPTAEATKVLENVQRDMNIALMNEVAVMFHQMGLTTSEVLKAARTKWNFLPFEPGLVGGDCIPIVPYYLTHKAQQFGYHPEVILASRRINDSMGKYVAQETVRLLALAGKPILGAKVLVLGVAFKENVRDVRNTRVTELVQELERFGVDVVTYDPVAREADVQGLGLKSVCDPFAGSERYDALVLAVAHKAFRSKPFEAYRKLFRDHAGPGVVVDVKGVLRDEAGTEGILYWSL